MYIYGPCGRPFPPPSQSSRVPHTKRRAAEEPGRRGGWGTFKLDSAAVCCDEGREGREGYFELARRFCRRLCETN